MSENSNRRPKSLPGIWPCSLSIFITTILAAVILAIMANSVLTRQRDQKGCSMSYMWPAFAHFADFDAAHTKLANKYSLYLYRELHIDEDTRVKGVPVLFVPGNAGSYKQVRPLAAQAAVHYYQMSQQNSHVVQDDKMPLDFFAVDFNEDFAAFHGKTLLDQAEYVNDAVSYILSLYRNPYRSIRDPNLPHPNSVILVGHSMGGIVARSIFTLPNYQIDSVNTIITLAAPHARPPLSFDADLVYSYKVVNDYWRKAFSQTLEFRSPLSRVTLISIAGGGLDTIVPSDYSTLTSIVPRTHGFTVFTSTIPEVWAGMDHLAITWCDQLRKSIISSLYDISDATHPAQTTSVAQRMLIFRKHFLTGLEDNHDNSFLQTGQSLFLINGTVFLTHFNPEKTSLLHIQDDSTVMILPGNRLTLGRITGGQQEAKTYIMEIPPANTSDGSTFRLLTAKNVAFWNTSGSLEILVCRVAPAPDSQPPSSFSSPMSIPKNDSGSMHFACKDVAPDAKLLPASTPKSKQPFDHYLVQNSNSLAHQSPPFKFLQYDADALVEYQFVLLVNHAHEFSPDWLIAEFASRSASEIQVGHSLSTLLFHGLEVLVENSSILSEIHVPCIRSSLLAYKLKLGRRATGFTNELFSPLLRQHTSYPFESKFFVNAKEVEINLHGDAPYVQSAHGAFGDMQGLSFQIWSDPTDRTPWVVTLKIDVLGSVGKLWMRYRVSFVTLPLMILALVIQRQLRVHDETGHYISFFESMNLCMSNSIPILLLFSTLLPLCLKSSPSLVLAMSRLFEPRFSATESTIDLSAVELGLGYPDPFFWYLAPLFGIISIGMTVALNYVVLGMTHVGAIVSTYMPRGRATFDKQSARAMAADIRRRIIVAAILLFLVATAVPYQFVFIVLCVVQLLTCVRALRAARETHKPNAVEFYNHAHGVLMLTLCVLPVNVPTLVVWIHNLAVHWLTPFSSHHSIFSIAPTFLLVELLSSGKTIPRVRSPLRHVTSTLFFFLAMYTVVYGATFTYVLHSIVNFIFAWLAAIHLSAGRINFKRLETQMTDFMGEELRSKVKKKP